MILRCRVCRPPTAKGRAANCRWALNRARSLAATCQTEACQRRAQQPGGGRHGHRRDLLEVHGTDGVEIEAGGVTAGRAATGAVDTHKTHRGEAGGGDVISLREAIVRVPGELGAARCMDTTERDGFGASL